VKFDNSKKKVIAGVKSMRKSYYEIKKFARKRTDEAKNELKKQYIELVK
jgi:hypothetical protein